MTLRARLRPGPFARSGTNPGASGGASEPVSIDLRTQTWVMGTYSGAFRGLGGDDVLVGQLGKDRLDGGAGFDRCRGANDVRAGCEDR